MPGDVHLAPSLQTRHATVVGDEAGSPRPPQRQLEMQGPSHGAVTAVRPNDQACPKRFRPPLDGGHYTLDLPRGDDEITNVRPLSHLDAGLTSALEQQGVKAVAEMPSACSPGNVAAKSTRKR